jgi:hypothetical protein
VSVTVEVTGGHRRGDLWGVQVSVPGDLSADDWRCQVRPLRDSATVVDADVSVVVDAGVTVVTATVEAADQDAAWWSPGAAIYWDVEVLPVGALSPQTIIAGKDRVEGDVTRVVTP